MELTFKERAEIIDKGVRKHIWLRADNQREYNFLPNGNLNISKPAETTKYELIFNEDNQTNILTIDGKEYGVEYNNVKDNPILYLSEGANRITFQVLK